MQEQKHWWDVIADRIGVLGVVAVLLAGLGLVVLALGYAAFRGATLLQVLGAGILKTGRSALPSMLRRCYGSV